MKGLKFLPVVIVVLLCLVPFFAGNVRAEEGIILYTPYTSLSVSPGETLSYDIEVYNMTDNVQNVSFSFRGLPGDWSPTITAGGNNIQRLAVKPAEMDSENSRDFDLDIEIPLRIEKGNYNFNLVAESDSGLTYVLPLSVNVIEEGTFKTELTADQANMEGYADSSFNYDLTLENRTAKTQNYALRAEAPKGWDVRFKLVTDYVTSVSLKSNESKNIDVEVKPSQNVKAGNYDIKIEAASGTTSSETNLEAVIKGKYNLNLSTPSGRLSREITAGGEKDIELVLKNTGTVTLRDIKLDASTPMDWKVEFDSKQITKLEPEEEITVGATIQAADKAIAGDYQLEIKATTPEASANASFRMTVKTSVLWGWIGILIIGLVIAGIVYLIRKYGRR